MKDGIANLLDSAKPLFLSGLSFEEAKTQTRKSFTLFPGNVESQACCPKTYFLCEKDEAGQPASQEAAASTEGFEVVRFVSGHSLFLTIPGEVVAAISNVALKVYN